MSIMKSPGCIFLFAILLLSAPIHTSTPKKAVSYKKEIIFAAGIIGLFLVAGIYSYERNEQQVVGAQLLNTVGQESCIFLYNKSCKVIQELKSTDSKTLEWSGHGTLLSALFGTTVTHVKTALEKTMRDDNFPIYGPLTVTYSNKPSVIMLWQGAGENKGKQHTIWLKGDYKWLNIPRMGQS